MRNIVWNDRVDRIVISAVLTGPLFGRSDELLRREIDRVFGPGMRCEVRPVAAIPKLNSGKVRITDGMGA